MASPSPNAEANRHRVTPLHAVHPSGYSLHGGGARSPETSRTSARFDDRPIHRADLAQSRLFQQILTDEVDELEDLITAAVRRWERQAELDADKRHVMPHAILRLRERLKEARRLLDALNRRFPPD
jgi:hypothetical protein